MRRTSSDGTDPSLLLARDFRYSADRAVEVVEGATQVIVVTGVSTMLALGIVLNIIGLGFFCWVLLTLAIYALPVLRRHDRWPLRTRRRRRTVWRDRSRPTCGCFHTCHRPGDLLARAHADPADRGR